MRKNILLLFVLFAFANFASAQTTEFTFQGSLKSSTNPANGNHDFEFALFDALTGGTQIGSTIALNNVAVTEGTFSVKLNFGNQFAAGTDRFLEVRVRQSGQGSFTNLSPRQLINSAPYSIKSLSADNATNAVNATNASNATNATNATNAATAQNALQLGGVAASEYVTNTSLGNTVIRNQTTQQSSANFNIQGNGTLGGTLSSNVVNTATEYRMDGFRILSAPTGTANLYAGFASGNEPGTGTRNSAFGYYAGENANSGGDNSYFGHFAGRFTVGGGNSFFGSSAGLNTAGGNNNTFVGLSAGLANTLGSNNTLLGANANVGANNLSFATAIGAGATVIADNTIVLGRNLGQDRVAIPGNTLIFRDLTVSGTLNGNGSGLSNLNAGSFTTGLLPISRGGTGLGSSGAAGTFLRSDGTNWTNSRILSEDIPLNLADYIWNSATLQNATFNIGGWGLIGGRLGVGTTTPGSQAEIFSVGLNGLRVQKNTAGGFVASFGENGVFNIDRVGSVGGRFTVLENGNVGIGTPSPVTKLEVVGTGIVRARVNSDTNAGLQLALGNQSKWSLTAQDNGEFRIWNYTIGQNALWITPNDNLFGIGTTSPTFRLEVVNSTGFNGLRVQIGAAGGKVASFGGVGEFQIDSLSGVAGGRLTVKENGTLKINNPSISTQPITGVTEMLAVNGFIRAFAPPLGVGIPICQEAVTSTFVLCAISSRRYKQDIQNFNQGLNVISRLRPVLFNWRANGQKDFGLIAEEVAEVDPMLTYTNANGETEGVKYDRIGVVLINAVKEQQEQIEAQQKKIDEQYELIKRQAEELERQRKELDALKRLVCATNPTAEICRTKN